MEKIIDFEKLKELINEKKLVLVYVSSPSCSVCEADLPRVEALVSELAVTSYQASILDVPQIRGQFQVFSAPTIMIFFEGKEYHRQARIIDFAELAHRLNQILDNM